MKTTPWPRWAIPFRLLLYGAAATPSALLLAACGDAPTDLPDPQLWAGECEPVDLGPDCQEEDVPVIPPGNGDHQGFLSSAFNDGRTWEAPGDPSRYSPGVWLGWDVTPSTCFATNSSNDLDRDDITDRCEFVLARAFSPMLQFHEDESCAAGEPYWGVARAFGNTVVISYLLAYYKDCGAPFDLVKLLDVRRLFCEAITLVELGPYPCLPEEAGSGDHNGDSEYAHLRVSFNNATKHWYVLDALSLAHGAPLFTRSADLTFPVRDRAFPMMWVALDKHATYPSDDCNIIGGGKGFTDVCTSFDRDIWYRLRVNSSRNVGSPEVPLPCQGSRTIRGTRKECFLSESRPFNGWMPTGDGVSPYYETLHKYFLAMAKHVPTARGTDPDTDHSGTCEDEPGLETEECINEVH